MAYLNDQGTAERVSGYSGFSGGCGCSSCGDQSRSYAGFADELPPDAAPPADAAPPSDATPPPAPAVKIPTPEEVARTRVPLEPEPLEQRLNRILRTPRPRTRRRRTPLQVLWAKVDQRVNAVLHRFRIPPRLRATIRGAVHSAIEKGTTAALEAALDQMGVGGPAKQAIMATARGAANTPLEGWQPWFHGVPDQHRKLVHRRPPVARSAGRVAGYSGFAGFGAPAFTINCANPPGCPPLAADRCNPVIRGAISEAIRLATNAAARIESVLAVAPASRNAEQQETTRLFRFFFRHDPLHQIQGPALEDSGISIAKRFRAVARELDGGRRVTFACLPDRVGCGQDLTCCDPGDNAWFHPAVPNTVNLCGGFWNPPATLRGLPHPTYRGAIIVHEMMHMLFRGVIGDTVPGRALAACYEAFALRVAGFGADRSDVCACRPAVCAAGGP